jgi:hypothetical protein
MSSLATRLFSGSPQLARLAVEHGAARRYRRLLANGQVRPLDRRELRITREYARDVLKNFSLAGSLRLYSAIAGEFREGWIPEAFFLDKVLPEISSPKARLTGWDRTRMTTVLGTDGVPEVGHRIAGQWYDPNGEASSREAIADQAAAFGPEVIVKLNGSRSGQGVRDIPVADLRGSEPSPGHDLVVQHLIGPHPTLEDLSLGSTPPLRLLTVMRAGNPTVAAAHIRLGTDGSRIVATHNALRIAVSLEGRIGDFGADRKLGLHRRHPSTGAPFAGLEVPSFVDAVERVLAWHRRLPDAGAIGWDLAIDPEGNVHLLELNTWHPGVFFHETLSGPNFTQCTWEKFAS